MLDNGAKKIIGGSLCLIVGIIVFWLLSTIIVDVPAGKLIVKQAFSTGTLEVYDEPGWKWQNFGRLTEYDRSRQLWFNTYKDKGEHTVDRSLPIRFSDGGTARISGSLRYDLPSGEQLIALHKRYKSMDAIERELLIPVIQKAIQLSGPIMTSKESAAARRNDLLAIIEDQMVNGVYRTDVRRVEVEDITSESGKKWVDILEPIKDPQAPNGIARAEKSPIKAAGITIHAIAITDIRYSEQVERAIEKQYELEMDVQTSKTATITANQRAVTAEAEGKAARAKAEWESRTEAEKMIVEAERNKKIAETQAEQRLRVAELDRQTAEKEKEAMILRAEGEAQSKERLAAAAKKQMDADGALTQKLDAYVRVNSMYAEALSKIQLPNIMLSSGKDGHGTANPVSDLLNMINAKTAHDLQSLAVDGKFK